MQIIVKSYSHINKSFANWDTPHGKLVKNKDHYDRLMKEGGYTAYEPGMDKIQRDGKPYIASKKALEIIRSAKATKDRKGNVHLGERTIDAMKEIGAIGKKIPSYMQLPEHYKTKGGFTK